MPALRSPGFSIQIFAQGLTHPRILAVRPDGTVYVTEREAGRVTLLRDTDGDGRADQQTSGVHGLALRGNQLYLVTVKQALRRRHPPRWHPLHASRAHR